MNIRCVTFDLDDTLWETGPVIERAELLSHDWLVQHAPGAVAGRTQVEMTAHRRGFYATLPQWRHDFTVLRQRWLRQIMLDAGLDEALAEQGFAVFWRARNAVEPFVAAVAAIERLGDDLLVGTITNGNACVHHIGIGHHFDFTVTAAEAGAMKPSPTIFRHALRLAGVAPHEAVHVGDDPRNDVEGARQAGMRTVWVNASGQPWPEEHGPPPDAEVRAVAAIEPVLRGWMELR